MYTRKTSDEYGVFGDYGHGLEEVTREGTFREARARRREYRENEPGVAFVIRKMRVTRKQEEEAK